MNALDSMVDHVKSILNELGLPYRVLKLCGGDLGFTSALTYDFEVYSTAQQRWLEISSVSTFNSFQAERLQLRYKDKEGKTKCSYIKWKFPCLAKSNCRFTRKLSNCRGN